MQKLCKNFIDDCLKANKEIKYYIETSMDPCDILLTGKVGEGGDKISGIDIIAENIFIKHLLKHGDIYSEESGLIKSAEEENILIIIDPLDGSDNFRSKLPYYGTSAALKYNDKVIAAVVFNLVNGEVYIKSYYDKMQIKSDGLDNPNLAVFERSYKSPEICKKLSDMGIKYRSPGAIAVTLANARSYKFVLFYGQMRIFDLEASLYICDDLNIYKNKHFLLVAKDIEIFSRIKEIIKEK